MHIFQSIFYVNLKALEKILQEILKKNQYFHTSRKFDHVEGHTTIFLQLHEVFSMELS